MSVRIDDEIYEGQWYRTMAQVQGLDGSDLTSSDMQSNSKGLYLVVYNDTSTTPDTAVGLYSYDGTRPTTAPAALGDTWTTDTSLDITDQAAIYDTRQTGSGWTKNNTGFNFIHDFQFPSLTVNGGERYRLEYSLWTASQGPVFVTANLKIKSLKST
jgi:hypothetical protein